MEHIPTSSDCTDKQTVRLRVLARDWQARVTANANSSTTVEYIMLCYRTVYKIMRCLFGTSKVQTHYSDLLPLLDHLTCEAPVCFIEAAVIKHVVFEARLPEFENWPC